MRTAILLPFLALATLGQAQVFTSGFENWPDTVPSDWMGSKTTLEADSVEQVTQNVHGGSFAVRLVNIEAGHKRFTTQPLTVVDGTSYDISFWVRGTGSVRTGLYDGRTTGSGYAPYNDYFVSSSDTWTQVIQQVVCANDTDVAQFILSVQLTNGPEHLVVDDVNITTGVVEPPVEASIYQIQSSVDGNGASTYDGQVVITGGIVTGVDTIGAGGYFIQAGTGPWSGVYVFDDTHQPAIGDSLELTARVDEWSTAADGVTELVNVTDYSVIGQYPLPVPQLLDTYLAAQEQWEGVLAVIANAECTAELNTDIGEWEFTQGSSTLIVDDLMYLFAPTLGAAYDVTGCIHYIASFGFRICPRFEADIVPATSIAEAGIFSNATLGPNPASDVLRINTGLPTGTLANYTFTDALGRTARTGILNGNGTLAVDDLTPGLYHLTLRTANDVKSFAVEVR